MFADSYFSKYKPFVPLIKSSPARDLSLFVMIPCMAEPDIINTLESLAQCDEPQQKTEVFVIINEPESCPDEISALNKKTFAEVESWSTAHNTGKIAFHTAPPVKLMQKWAGAGLARKHGMDEALWRFNQIENWRGVIISLDADTLVDANYLTAIEQHFAANSSHVGATIAFSHQLEGLDEKHKCGILLYEKYMKYYKEASTFTGFPNALFSIGSAFAVTAEGYMRRGGMTRRKAGEDFYFLQTLTQTGKVGEINNTSVHPSARVSDRVPFGTGPTMQRWMNNSPDLQYTYDFNAFRDLKKLFSQHAGLYKISNCDYRIFLQSMPETVQAFLAADDFWEKLENLNANCGNTAVFNSRFFQIFNAFKILKFIKFTHEHFYGKRPLDDVWNELKDAESAISDSI
ncbi:MAG: hypothetical protein FWG22_01370 [Prolixibacteraceae bacterium]|nr:hypothetical protein [Prolixibacteraceae bacterium]